MRDLAFYCVAAVMLAGAAGAVALRNLLHAGLSLMATLLGTAALYFLLEAEFLALAQVMVYVGGIVTFLLYAIMITSARGERIAAPSPAKALGAALVAGALAGMLWTLARGVPAGGARAALPGAGGLGALLLSAGEGGYLAAFEWISALLLAVLVGASAVARRDRAMAPADPRSAGRQAPEPVAPMAPEAVAERTGA